MKTRICAALLSVLLAIPLLAGCVLQPAPTETQEPRQLFQVDITKDAPELADIILEESVPLGEAPIGEKQLTKEEAIAIALEKAGLTQEQVTALRAEFDLDDGRPEYEVEFHHSGWEYDYEIHAETGAVLKAEKEKDD